MSDNEGNFKLFAITFDLHFQLFEIIRLSSSSSSDVASAFLDRAFDVCKSDMTDLTRLALRFDPAKSNILEYGLSIPELDWAPVADDTSRFELRFDPAWPK